MLYDGFFDATYDEEKEQYDRAYDSSAFVDYFANFIGSGVCIHGNPDSFKVSYQGGSLTIAPGYLFIQGFWLKNDADYTVPLGAGVYAVVARLDTGSRMITLATETKAGDYESGTTLVLAYVTVSSGGSAEVEDTRYNDDICGVIDSAGNLSTKVEWAVNYINTEINARLEQAEQNIATQAAVLDAKIAEVSAEIDKIQPDAVGTIKFSASKDIGDGWLRCDGRFVSEKDYPELVEALGKLIPSGDKFQLISSGEIGHQISNGVIYDGRMWVYSCSTQKLYGVDVDGGEAIKEIIVTSTDPEFSRVHALSTSQPIALSIVQSPIDGTARVFLAQILVSSGSATSETISENLKNYLWLYYAEFSADKSNLSMSAPFTTLTIASGSHYFISNSCVPYVVSRNVGGKETFSTLTALHQKNQFNIIQWTDGASSATSITDGPDGTYSGYTGQRISFSRKSKGEAVAVGYSYDAATNRYVKSDVWSLQNEIFSRDASTNVSENAVIGRTNPTPLNIAGENKILFSYDTASALTINLKELQNAQKVNLTLSIPSDARIFVDGGAYLWGKDIYMIFVGTGIIFSRTLENGSFGYLDTTSVLGTITQFGYLDYSEDEGTLYLLGQDTTNSVKVAKIVLNTLYDYANDGAWLPNIASDGVPAYIKAVPTETSGGDEDSGNSEYVTIDITVTIGVDFSTYATVLFNGEPLIAGTYKRTLLRNGTFTAGLRTTNKSSTGYSLKVAMNGTTISIANTSDDVGTEKTLSFAVSDYVSSGIKLSATYRS